MVEAADEADVRLGIAYHLRWHGGHRALHEMAMAGELGTLRHMRVQWPMASNPSNWRASSDLARWWCLSGVGTHCLDQIRWFMTPSCGEVTRVESVIGNAGFGSPHDETAVLALQFENGATAELCSSVLFSTPPRMELYGSEGYALCDGTLGPRGAGTIVTGEGPFAFEAADPYVGEMEDFAAAVAAGRDPEVNGEEGLRNVDILLQAVGEAD